MTKRRGMAAYQRKSIWRQRKKDRRSSISGGGKWRATSALCMWRMGERERGAVKRDNISLKQHHQAWRTARNNY